MEKRQYLRASLTKGALEKAERAMRGVRIAHNHEPEFRGHGWKSAALDIIFQLSLDHESKDVERTIRWQERVLRRYRLMRKAKGKPVGSREIYRIEQKIRDRWSKKRTSPRKRVWDTGQLLEAVIVSVARHIARCQYSQKTPDEIGVLNIHNTKEYFQAWNDPNQGGFLVKVEGDPRAFGVKPVLLWLETDALLAIQPEYSRLISEYLHDPKCRITELLPPDETIDWDPPQIATSRRIIEEGDLPHE